jgi:hypothetical protein
VGGGRPETVSSDDFFFTRRLTDGLRTLGYIVEHD